MTQLRHMAQDRALAVCGTNMDCPSMRQTTTTVLRSKSIQARSIHHDRLINAVRQSS